MISTNSQTARRVVEDIYRRRAHVGGGSLRNGRELSKVWEGCRAAPKTESAKRDFLLQTSMGAYATTGRWWADYWYCHL
jgi:hypothetical protein